MALEYTQLIYRTHYTFSCPCNDGILQNFKYTKKQDLQQFHKNVYLYFSTSKSKWNLEVKNPMLFYSLQTLVLVSCYHWINTLIRIHFTYPIIIT